MISQFDLFYDNDEDDDEDEDEDEGGSTPLIDLIIPKREDGYKGFLPNLQTFLLSAASFKGLRDSLIEAFNLYSVKELRLLKCKQTIELLHYITQTSVSLQATKVELVLLCAEIDGIELKVIDFLFPFESLEDLFLLVLS